MNVSRPSGDRPLKVLLCAYGWAEEGGGTAIPRELAQGLAEAGHEVAVLYASRRLLPGASAWHVVEGRQGPVRLFEVVNRPAPLVDLEHPEREQSDALLARRTAELLERLRPDLLHIHNLAGLGLSVAAEAARAKIPFLYTPHNYWPLCPRLYLVDAAGRRCEGPDERGERCAACLGLPGRAEALASRAGAAVALLGHAAARQLIVSTRVGELLARGGFPRDRMRLLRQQTRACDRLWERLGSRGATPGRGPLRVAFIGSLVALKGPHVLVAALQAFDGRQAEGHFIGHGSPEFNARLRALDRKGVCRFHGRRPAAELPDLLAGMDLLVVPSLCEECAPLAALEGHAAGLPVLASRVGGLPDLVRDGRDGALLPPGDPVALARLLLELGADRERIARLREGIEPPRGFQAYLDEVIGHYRDAAGRVEQRPGPGNSRQRYSLYHAEGGAAAMAAWLAPYADLFRGRGPVLDLGCGPGHFLRLLAERGVEALGVDHDPDMVRVCLGAGLPARLGDLAGALPEGPEVGGIHLGHVIEHMDGPSAVALLERCAARLRPGGLLLVRTPNWANATVRSGGFWLDHTHVRPYPLELLERIFEDLGLEVAARGAESFGWNDLFIAGVKGQADARLRDQRASAAAAATMPAQSS